MKNLINLLYSVTTIKDLRQRFLQYETQKINRDKLKQQLNVAEKEDCKSDAGEHNKQDVMF